MYDLVEMMTYKRPQGSDTQKEFCNKYLEPIMGLPDKYGNYVLTVGNKPQICFTAHHDTVHKTSGRQKLAVTKDGIVSLKRKSKGECLGADCTTGIWLICNMINAKIPGVYVVHAEEEGGCVGSKALVKSDPQWLDDINYVISFDRYGKKSVITHQMGRRTASDKFAKLLAKTLELPLKPDPNGSYTDSNVYRSKVSECTNVSVGYYSQHSTEEKQDVVYAYKLLECLLSADWDQLQYYRDNTVVEMGSMYGDWYDDDDYFFGYPPRGYRYDIDQTGDNRIYDMIVDYPEEIALLLEELGYTADELHEMLGIQDHGYINEYLERVS